MKLLALLRHAKSSWAEPGLHDFERPLNRRGREAAMVMGKELRRRGARFDLTLASPARRVVETLARFETGYGATLDPHFDPRLYEASCDELLEAVRQASDDVRSVLLVGHNPGLQGLATALTARDDPMYRRVADRYPTGAVALLEFPVAAWTDLTGGSGRISELLIPRELMSGNSS